MTQPTPAPTPEPVKPGWTTSEFYVTVLTTVLPILGVWFHGTVNLSAHAQDFALLLAGIASAGYSLSRAITKGLSYWRSLHAVPPVV